MILAPSILSADFSRLGQQIEALEEGGANWVHVDVMDGHFVPNLSFGPWIIPFIKKHTSLPVDVHLMVTNPDELIPAFVEGGANQITVHVETCPHLPRTMQNIRTAGCKAGVALNPATPLHVLEWVWDHVDLVLLLATNPGFSGQKYLPQTTAKIAGLDNMIHAAGSQAILQVDGGVNANTLVEISAAGATSVVTGNAVFKHPGGISAGIYLLREICQSGPG